ncbi:MAG: aldehyde dehydrogenase family protein [Solirubrobacterales bacterium]|nr:aldehyde dehydrogenase family protein [Solirubrobacterales bacterium]
MASLTEQPSPGRAAATIGVENPATGELITTVPLLGEAELREMAARARGAQPGWEEAGFEERGRILRRAQRWLVDHVERVLDVVCSESGKTVEDAQVADYGYTVGALGFWAKQAPKYLADEHVPSWSNPLVAGKRLVIRYAPVGVVGVIGPWNYPITNSFGDCIPALAAGNSVILKPSEETPLSSLLMEEMLRDCGLPEGVFQVATGDGSTGAALIGQVDCIMFTGSTETGKKVMRAAAVRLIPCYLELGGKDPMIVCADADVERAANAATFYSMNNSGQVCISVERCYVEAPVYEEFVQKVTDNVSKLRQGPPGEMASVDVGAMTFPPQLDIVEDHVQDAVTKGARVLVGGQGRRDPGRFFEPTVLVDVDHSMKIMREETFGPTLPIMKVSDTEEAVRLANDSPYGLQASVWTRDTERGEAVARRVQAGVVCVNDAQVNYTALNLPMGGWKASGLGTRHGAAGIRKYTQVQSLLVTKLAPKRDLHMFPYTKVRTQLLRGLVKFLYGRGKRD